MNPVAHVVHVLPLQKPLVESWAHWSHAVPPQYPFTASLRHMHVVPLQFPCRHDGDPDVQVRARHLSPVYPGAQPLHERPLKYPRIDEP
jgi:hypothetical protein